MMGPNTVSGHLSVIYTTECQINFALRLLQPVMRALRAARSPSALPQSSTQDVVSVTPEAEGRDIDATQDKARRLVWASGCTSWFIHKSGRNTAMFPDWQYKFWLRSVFIPWQDFSYHTSASWEEESRGSVRIGSVLTTAAVVGALLGSVAYRCYYR
jgi:hypothetical protein